MRIIRFEDGQHRIRLARVTDDNQAQLLEEADQNALFAAGTLATPALAASTGELLPMPDQLLAPLDPVNIFCIGLNYADHAKEGGSDPPPRPVIFMKPTTALNHPGGAICIPACEMDGPETDYEGELVVIIGRTARDVSEDEALDYVFGYTCGIDVSARKWQKKGCGGQFIRGKGFDSFCPLGPCIVTADELADPQSLELTTTLNGRMMQHASTSSMIFPVRRLVSFISQDTTLLPGTIIMTGTPEGVGAARKPPVWLKGGDQLSVEIKGIGTLSNPVRQT